MTESLASIVDWCQDMLLMQLTPLHRRQVEEAISKMQEDLNKFQTLSEHERFQCVKNAQLRQNEIAERWKTIFKALPDAMFYFVHLYRFENFFIDTIKHEHLLTPLSSHYHILSIARIKGVEPERQLAANVLTDRNIDLLDPLYDKIVSLVTTEFELSQSYLEIRLTAVRLRRENEQRYFLNLSRYLRWKELAILTSGDEHLILFFDRVGNHSDMPTQDLLESIRAVHKTAFVSPIGELDFSLSPWAKRYIERAKILYPDYNGSSDNNTDDKSVPAENIDKQLQSSPLIPTHSSSTSAIDFGLGKLFNRKQDRERR